MMVGCGFRTGKAYHSCTAQSVLLAELLQVNFAAGQQATRACPPQETTLGLQCTPRCDDMGTRLWRGLTVVVDAGKRLPQDCLALCGPAQPPVADHGLLTTPTAATAGLATHLQGKEPGCWCCTGPARSHCTHCTNDRVMGLHDISGWGETR